MYKFKVYVLVPLTGSLYCLLQLVLYLNSTSSKVVRVVSSRRLIILALSPFGKSILKVPPDD